MNVKSIIQTLTACSKNIFDIERALVYVFIKQKNINYLHSAVLSGYISKLDQAICEKAMECFNDVNDLSLDSLVELFEQIVPENEKKEKGIVYTPKEIKEYIVSLSCQTITPPTVIDPSCGCGAFLVTAAKCIHDKYDLDYCDIISNYIYGIDIDKNAIRKATILLELLSCMNNEYKDKSFNFIHANALDPKTIAKTKKWQPKGFDSVIGNPPYVRYRNMSDESKKQLTHWNSAKVGNVDLYIPFFEVGITLLKKNARLSYITPNSYMQAVNGRKLREYLSKQKRLITIVDFRDTQIFKNVTSYTCITTIDFSKADDVIKYARISDKDTLVSHNYSEYRIHEFSNGAPWRMRRSDIDYVIEKLESAGTPLSKWKIRNGLATLKNDVYFFTPTHADERFYYRVYNKVEYKIERDICIKVVKPNIIKNEKDLQEKIELAIFPYISKGNIMEIICEQEMISKYPFAYNFLSNHRKVLENRDKGKADYPTWYAYGRTQGMNNFGKKLLIPYISGEPIAVLSLDEELLFYCGYALMSEKEEELKLLKCFLESDAFWYYVYHTSKPYSKGYMSFAKNYIVNFSIPLLSQNDKKYLLSSPPKLELNQWIWAKYGIDGFTNITKR